MMTGVNCSDIQELEKRGYRIREHLSKTQLLKENEVIAEITIDNKALLMIEVEGEELKDLKWIEIQPVKLPKTIFLEMKDEKGKQYYCEFPTRENQPIFW